MNAPAAQRDVDVPLARERWLQQAAQEGTDWPAVLDGCRDLLAVAVGESAHMDTFEKAYREADRKAGARPREADLDRHCRLLDDHVTLAAASAKQRKNEPTPPTAVEALMYSLRRSINDLTRPDTLRRLSALDDIQLKAVCRRVQNFKLEIATPWSSEEVAALIARWRELHDGR